MSIRVIETFLYNGDAVVPYHLELVYPLVDHIFVVEARETFSGHPKETLYHEENRAIFAPYADKITFLVVDRYPEPPPGWETTPMPPYVVPGSHTAWFRDMYSHEFARAFIVRAYDPLPEPYVVVAVDADEIPHPDLLKEMRNPDNYHLFQTPISLRMRHFCYSFDWVRRMDWFHPTAMNRDALATNTLSGARMGVNKTHFIPRAGWHCSYFGSIPELQRKIASFAHREYDAPEIVDEGNLLACQATGRSLSPLLGNEDDTCVQNHNYTDLPPGWERYVQKK